MSVSVSRCFLCNADTGGAACPGCGRPACESCMGDCAGCGRRVCLRGLNKNSKCEKCEDHFA